MGEQLNTCTLSELELVSGKKLSPVSQAYSINGTPEPDGSNVILVCHSLTSSHHLVGGEVKGLPQAWFDTMVGPGRALDTNRVCVIAVNHLCSPYGSSSPMEVNPATGKPWGMSFPVIAPRDIAAAQKKLLEYIGIPRIACVIGGSLGGMIALEMALSFPDFTGCAAVIAAPAWLYPQAIAYNEVQRRSIMSDPDWAEGDYYPGQGPVKGLSVARMLAMITYRTEQNFAGRWMRELALGNAHEWGGKFQVESYLEHHGMELVNRFDANCYLYMTKLMDLHDAGFARESVDAAFARYAGKSLLAVGISSDILFPNWQVNEMTGIANKNGVKAQYEEIESDNGHDAFLIDFDQLDDILRSFLKARGL